MKSTKKEFLYASIIIVSVIFIYCEQIKIIDYLPDIYHYLIPAFINPVTLLAIPIIKAKGLIWGTMIVVFSMIAIFWEGTIFISLIIALFLAWICLGILLLLKKVFKDKHIEFFLKINIAYGFLIFVSVGFLVLFIAVLGEKNNVWVNSHLMLIQLTLPVLLCPVFFFFSTKAYRNMMSLIDTMRPEPLTNSTIAKEKTDSSVIEMKR